MRETSADLRELQQLLDGSFAAAGAHLRSIFDEQSRLTAEGVVGALDGIFEMHLATVTGAGAPLVAPLDGIFFKGKIWFGFPDRSVRARLVRRDPRVSASYTRGPVAFIVHGTAHEVDDHEVPPEYDALMRDLYAAQYGPGWIDWYERQRRDRVPGAGFGGYIEPRRMFAKD
jgi:hypothetical protein